MSFSFLAQLFQPYDPFQSGVNDEKGLPKDDQAEPPKGLRFPFGGSSCLAFFKSGVLNLWFSLP
jgi:hypothetical protein